MKPNVYKIILVSFVLALFSCDEKNKLPSEAITITTTNKEASNALIQVTQSQFEHSSMELGSLSEQSFPKIVTASGMIDVPPENRAVVNASMGGYIKTTPLLVGDRVRQGQVLVTITNPEFVSMQQAYMEVHEQLTYLKAEYERQVTMKTENITSQKSYLKAESDYKTAVARHLGLEKQLRMLHISPAQVQAGMITSVVSIYAPISGSITKMNVTKGSYVSPATEILEIIDNDHIHLELSVFEKDIMKIKKGQEIDFRIPEASSDAYKAEVHLVGTSIGANRTIKVHGHLDDDANHNFLIGMFVEANIITDTTPAMALPSEAIVAIDDTAYVLVLKKKDGDDYYFNEHEVVIKDRYNNFFLVEIKDNVQPNTQFLTKGAFNLLGE